jgi:hypothetical protein
MISEPMVCLVQTVHLSYVKISTICKRTEIRFQLSFKPSEYHRVHLKWFLSLWYVRRKPCTYLASRLALSPNGLKRASTWASSSSNSIGCIQNDFLACGTFAKLVQLSCNCTNTIPKWTKMRFQFHRVRPKQFLSLWYVWRKPCTYLASRLALSPNGPKWVSTSATSPRSTIGCIKIISKPMVLWRKSCTYLAPTLTLPPNGPKWYSTWPTSLRNSIGCVQNDFQAYGRLAQTVHLSCTYTNTVSKWTKMRFHTTHVT